MMKIALLLTGLCLFVALVVAGCATSRLAYESPEYSVLQEDGSFEVRQYPDMTVVSTPMKSSNPNEDDSFMKLFGYIAKGNEDNQKIAMTTPVFMSGDGDGEMSFVVPKEVAAEGAPQPNSDQLALGTMAGGKFAVYRYSGSWKENRRNSAEETLGEWVAKQGLKTQGKFISAGYDPPFTPPPLRRNEVLIRLAN